MDNNGTAYSLGHDPILYFRLYVEWPARNCKGWVISVWIEKDMICVVRGPSCTLVILDTA